MGIGRFALKALRWIGWIAGFVKSPLGQEVATELVGKEMGKKVVGYMGFLDWLERRAGAHTEVWRKTLEARKAGVSLELAPREVEYLFQFKKGWDRWLKKPLQKLAKRLGLDQMQQEFEEGMDDGESLDDAFVAEPDQLDEPTDPEG